MQLLNVSTLPIFLANDEAHAPFGDPFNDATITSNSAGAVITVPGYDSPTAGDLVVFTAEATYTLASGLAVGTVYYVVSPSGDTFSVSATSGGSAIGTTTSNSTAGQVTVHLVSDQVDGVTIPFKSGNSAIALNLSGASITLQGAPDKLITGAWGTFGVPGGPGTWSTIATIASGAAALVLLSSDWIRVTSSGTLLLLQN
jgi:hypothetical protein